MDDWFKSEGAKLARGTYRDVADHIDHLVKVAGIDHVGIGSDFDGITMWPVGLDDVSSYPRLTDELLRRGYCETDIHKILGGNVLTSLSPGRRGRQAAAGDHDAGGRRDQAGKTRWLSAHSVLRYSIRSIRSSSDSSSPNVWPPLFMPKRAVSTMNLA